MQPPIIPIVQPEQVKGEKKSASPIPLILAIIAIAVSTFLYFIYRSENVPTYIFVFGYLLTPFSVVLLMGCDTIFQRRNLSENPWFVSKPTYTKVLRVLVILSFVCATPHIWRISQAISEFFNFSSAGT